MRYRPEFTLGPIDPLSTPSADHAKASPPLADIARDYKRGAASPQELFEVFVEATLFWLAPATEGIPVVRVEEKWVAPVFSSEAELARVVGRKRWLSTTGLHFLSLLPPGVAVGLDMGSAHRLELDPAAARLEFGLVVPARPAANPSDHNGDG